MGVGLLRGGVRIYFIMDSEFSKYDGYERFLNSNILPDLGHNWFFFSYRSVCTELKLLAVDGKIMMSWFAFLYKITRS